jgi:endoglucanase Acf2
MKLLQKREGGKIMLKLSYFVVFILAVLIFSGMAQVKVGKGGYVTTGSFAVPDVSPYVIPNFQQKVLSAKWWVTLITTQYSQNLFAHPCSYRATANGLEMGYPGAPGGGAGDFYSSHSRSLTINVQGLNAPDARVAAHSHFSVTARFTDGSKTLDATMCQGIPFVYCKITGGPASISFNGSPTIWYNQGGVVGATVGGKHFGIFAPTGSSWSGTETMTSTLNGKDYLSVALLPDNREQTLMFFKQYAYTFPKETRVSWNYNDSNAVLNTVFYIVPDIKEGSETGTIFAMMRHHWLWSKAPLTEYVYQSPRGVMKVTAGQSFTTEMPFNGILATMPDTGYDQNTLNNLVNSISPPTIRGSTYNKDFGKYAQVAQIAEQVGNTTKRDQVLAKLKDGLETWFTPGSSPQFYYHQPWNRLIGYPAAYYSDTRLTDHHFHYGYFVQAAAVVARFDREWAKQENWGGMVEMLIRDVNSWDDNDPLFARFGYFEPYEGHGWADGMGFDRGNNQESSSESMNFNAGVIMWGNVTGNKTVRDLGIFMWCHEARAIEQYWWDADDVVFPSSFPHTVVGMVWSNGGAYGTWFSGNTGAIHGINFLPQTAGHLYLGRRPDYIPKNYNEGFSGQWSDLFYQFLAFADPATAVQKYNSGTGIEGGNTQAACYMHIFSLNAVGKLNTEIGANIPSFAVFDKGNIRCYNAYNPDNTERTVTFTDGFSMVVPPNKQIHKVGVVRPVSTIDKQKIANKNIKFKIIGTASVMNGTISLNNVLHSDLIEIYSLSGKKICILNLANHKNFIKVPKNVPNGLYLIKAKEEK